jgi:hypothetical protein
LPRRNFISIQGSDSERIVPVVSNIRAVTSFLFFLANAILVYAEPLAAGMRSVTKSPL